MNGKATLLCCPATEHTYSHTLQASTSSSPSSRPSHLRLPSHPPPSHPARPTPSKDPTRRNRTTSVNLATSAKPRPPTLHP
jgi:hypothetical protein